MAPRTKARATPRRPATMATVALLLASALFTGCAVTGNDQARDRGHGPFGAEAVGPAQSMLGIEVVALRLTASGTMLDLRFRVVNPERAKEFLARGTGPHLLEPSTGARLAVPSSSYIGALRQTAVTPELGKVYFVLFGNPGRVVREGQEVLLVLGGLSLPVTVEGRGASAGATGGHSARILPGCRSAFRAQRDGASGA